MKIGGAVDESDANRCLHWDSTRSVCPATWAVTTWAPALDSALLSLHVLPLDQLVVMTHARS